jgi:phenylalanyl-tRNA synthetase beta chain
MQFPESWLREFCDPALSTQALADALTMAGLEVEDLQPAAAPFSGVVVGEILSAEQHPNADRLRVCQVSVGAQLNGGQPLSIVCGAPNARPGIKVPCAMVGAALPPAEGHAEPFQIKLSKLRGVESQGMLCSARELKLSEEHGGLLELDLGLALGQNLRTALQLDDTVFTLKLTPNKADCLSVLGVAREVAAITGAPLRQPAIAPAQVTARDKLPVQVAAADLCGRFSGRVVKGLNPAAATPAWMVQRLARCGQRPVSALVDISNYVMFELGRPSHIFDLDKIHGGLTVRWGRPGEQLKLLNGQTVELDDQVGVIADDLQVESLAGIMGGDATAVGDNTRNVYIEAAFWHPAAIAGRSRRYCFSTDAGHRFERGVDFATTAEHVQRITTLVLEICGTPNTQVGPLDDQVVQLPPRAPVRMRVARASKVIGMPVSTAQCADVFRRLGLKHEAVDAGDVLVVTPPSHRFDLQLEEDLIEEVARLVGYDALPNTPPLAPVVPSAQPADRVGRFALARQLAARGYLETINFSFVPEAWERDFAGNADPIRLLNPIASEMNVMRSTLLGSLVGALKHNIDRKAPSVRLFEIGRVFHRDPEAQASLSSVAGVTQPMRVAGLAWGPAAPAQWGQAAKAVDFYDVKGDVEAVLLGGMLEFVPPDNPGESVPALHPGRAAKVFVDGQPVGHIGELHPRWVQRYNLHTAPIVFELDFKAAVARRLPQPRPAPRLQSVLRDLAIVVSRTISHAQVMKALAPLRADGILREVFVFDVFTPKQDAAREPATPEISMALRVELRDDEAPLTDVQIDQQMKLVLHRLGQPLEQGGVAARLRT